jgi:hypothetical protein
MGYYTDFYGRLDFVREMTDDELSWIEEIIHADHADITPEMARTIRQECEAQSIIYDGLYMASRRMELLGFVAPKGAPGYIDYEITEDRKGLEYNKSEKAYRMVEGLDFIIANARRKIPDFSLTGRMFASTEFEPYHWFIEVGKGGWAEQVPCEYEEVERVRLSQIFAQPRPELAKMLCRDADGITIVNQDSEVVDAHGSWLGQEGRAGVVIEVGGGHILGNGHMNVTLRMEEARALAKWLTRRIREEQIWRVLPSPVRTAWIAVKKRLRQNDV